MTVELVCEVLRREDIGTRAAIRADPANPASLRVAEKAGFRFERQFVSSTDRRADGTPAMLDLYVLDLNASQRWAGGRSAGHVAPDRLDRVGFLR